MKKMNKLAILLLCLGFVGATAACDISSLTGMIGGNSVESTAQSTGEEETSTETASESEKDGQSSESDGGETSDTGTPDEETPDGGVTENEWNEMIFNLTNAKFEYFSF